MIRLTASLACIIVAIDSVLMATGLEPQTIFSPENVWMWWIPSVGWVVVAILNPTE